MPIYNEELAVASVLQEWLDELKRLGIDFELRCYNDGSKDGSLRVLEDWATRETRLVVTTQENRGHGPTIMRGYVESGGDWVFQTDGDGEMPAASFAEFWRVREHADAVQGRRVDRGSTLQRRILSKGARLYVRLLFGRSPDDANVPYRLFRGSWLRTEINALPGNTAVPNIILSGLAATRGRVIEIDVPFRARRTGTSTLNLRRILRLAIRAVIDTAAVAFRTPRQ
jgi:dolichol-phosphate mannosyltransferase